MDAGTLVTTGPLVSVIMNCFNGERFLRQAIDSVLAQTYERWEIVFWDNQSTDGSAGIVGSYADPRVRYFRAPTHTRLYEARNRAIEQARGEFIAFLDVDDWWSPDKLARQMPLFDDAEVGLVCGNFWLVSERTGARRKKLRSPAPTGRVLDELFRSYFVGVLTLVVRRSALESLDHACDPDYHIIGDFDLVVRLAIGWKVACVQEPIAYYRLHEGSESATGRSRHADELDRWLVKMRAVTEVRSCPHFGAIAAQSAYLRAMHQVASGARGRVFHLLRQVPWGRLKWRLLVAFCLPPFLFRRFSN